MTDEPPVPSIDAKSAEARLRAGEVPTPILLDVREPNEFAAGRAVGATHMPLSTRLGRFANVIC